MQKKYIPLVLSLIFTGCAGPKLIINYSESIVAEEGGIRFTQFTSEFDKVVGPRVSSTPSGLEWYAASAVALSPDGEKLAFLGRGNSNEVDIFIKNTSGGQTTVQRTHRGSVNIGLCYTPDGKHISFTDGADGNSNVYMIHSVEGAAVQQITNTSSDEIGPHFSPHGKNVFFCKSERSVLGDGSIKYRYFIWSFDRETSLLTQYAEGFTPVCTPDGSKLLITRNNKQTNKGEIWMIDINSGQETLLLRDQNRGFSSPSISPDGKRIVCVGTTESTTSRPENLDLYSFKIDGTGLTQLTFHPGHDVSPVWSPSGKNIYFVSMRGNEKGSYNIWNMEFKEFN